MKPLSLLPHVVCRTLGCICFFCMTGLRLSKTIESLWRRVTTDIFSKRRKICPAWWHFRGWADRETFGDNTEHRLLFLAEMLDSQKKQGNFAFFFPKFERSREEERSDLYLPLKIAIMAANGPKSCGLIILLLQFVCASSSRNTAHEAACQVVTSIIDCASYTHARMPFVCTLILHMCVLSP